MKITLDIYNKCKYEPDSKIVAKVELNAKSYFVSEITEEEIFEEGFDDVDPYGEYLIIRSMDDEISTFRNSYVDMFKGGTRK